MTARARHSISLARTDQAGIRTARECSSSEKEGLQVSSSFSTHIRKDVRVLASKVVVILAQIGLLFIVLLNIISSSS